MIKVGAGLSGIGLNILGTIMSGNQITLNSIFASGWAIMEGMAEFNFFTTGDYFLNKYDRY